MGESGIGRLGPRYQFLGERVKLAEEDNLKARPEPTDLQAMRVRRDSPNIGSRDVFLEMKRQLQAEMTAYADPGLDLADRRQVRRYVHECLDDLLTQKGIVLNKDEKRLLLDAIVADLIDQRS